MSKYIYINKIFAIAMIMLSALPCVHAKDLNKSNANSKNSENDVTHLQCKPSDLPLYTQLLTRDKREVNHRHDQPQSVLHENVESAIRRLRVEMKTGWHFITQRTDYINEQYYDAKSRVLRTVDYLNEPQNLLPRTGAIAAGGLTGLLFSVRGGIVRKFFFTTIGAGTVASMCYPHQAEQLTQDFLRHARRGYNISYNFVKGVKPGEEADIEHVSKFPRSLEDIKLLIYDLFDEAKHAIFPPK